MQFTKRTASEKDGAQMKKQKKKSEEPVILTTVSSNYQLGLIKSILEENHIPCLMQDRGSGGYMRLYAGGSIFGTDIYVSPDNLEIAKELIKVISSEQEEVSEEELAREALEAEIPIE